MKYYAVLLIASLAAAAPATNDLDDSSPLLVTKDFFPKELLAYTSQHDIVNIYVPLNNLNFDEDEEDDNTKNESSPIVFFVEADFKDGKREDKGLYYLQNQQSKKLLDNGRDITATKDETKSVYFGASDGIYIYNDQAKTAEKYGSIADSIIGIAKDNSTDGLYILTEGKELYKVSDNGTTKVKIEEVKNAEQIVMDNSNNLYYYGADKKPYVYSNGVIKAVNGLPENLSEVTLLRPPFLIEDGVPFVADKKAYVLYANATSELSDFTIDSDVKITAFSMEATLIQYYGYDKKIYEYNILELILGDMVDALKEFLNDNKDSIQSIATRSRNDLHA